MSLLKRSALIVAAMIFSSSACAARVDSRVCRQWLLLFRRRNHSVAQRTDERQPRVSREPLQESQWQQLTGRTRTSITQPYQERTMVITMHASLVRVFEVAMAAEGLGLE